jgi:hypothetical protein
MANIHDTGVLLDLIERVNLLTVVRRTKDKKMEQLQAQYIERTDASIRVRAAVVLEETARVHGVTPEAFKASVEKAAANRLAAVVVSEMLAEMVAAVESEDETGLLRSKRDVSPSGSDVSGPVRKHPRLFSPLPAFDSPIPPPPAPPAAPSPASPLVDVVMGDAVVMEDVDEADAAPVGPAPKLPLCKVLCLCVVL